MGTSVAPPSRESTDHGLSHPGQDVIYEDIATISRINVPKSADRYQASV